MRIKLWERRFVRTDQCWDWIAAVDKDGYGIYNNRRAHRVSYERYVGPIPQGLDIDHLCRNRACINPAHLEPVTNAENHRRAALVRQHCRYGHPYSESNMFLNREGARICRTCTREQDRNRKRSSRNYPACRATTSQYRGVHLQRHRSKWTAQIRVGGEQIYLGVFQAELDAALAYDAAARRLLGPDAQVNFAEAPTRLQDAEERLAGYQKAVA